MAWSITLDGPAVFNAGRGFGQEYIHALHNSHPEVRMGAVIGCDIAAAFPASRRCLAADGKPMNHCGLFLLN